LQLLIKIKRHNLKSASNVQAAIKKKLLEYGIITVENNPYFAEYQLFYHWLQAS